MREIRQSGSEGGGGGDNPPLPTPIRSLLRTCRADVGGNAGVVGGVAVRGAGTHNPRLGVSL